MVHSEIIFYLLQDGCKYLASALAYMELLYHDDGVYEGLVVSYCHLALFLCSRFGEPKKSLLQAPVVYRTEESLGGMEYL